MSWVDDALDSHLESDYEDRFGYPDDDFDSDEPEDDDLEDDDE